MNAQAPTFLLVREHFADVFLGTVFSFIGLAACMIAAVRRRSASRLLVWFGLFIGLYGVRMLAHWAGVLGLFPGSPWPDRIEIAVNYVLVVPSFLFWAERTRSVVRRAFQVLAAIGFGIATVGLTWYAISGSPYPFMLWSFLLAIGSMLVLGPLAVFPRVFKKYFDVQSLVLRVVMPAIAVLVLVVDVMLFFGHPPSRYIEPMGFAVWVFAIGYEAAKNTFDNEKRLFSLDGELEAARQIQSSLLPCRIPVVAHLRIAATYKPMSAVAGDYYQFLQTDDHRVRVFVADVAGHGVPAALIASMIKVAMQSELAFSSEPSELLRNLNRILTPELQGKLTSAAYLWIDTEKHCAAYSAAGHPPLLQWRAASRTLVSIESNGLLIGVAEDAQYPVRSISLEPGDRILLYTDGLVEPEDSHGESFGDEQLERVLSANRDLPACELSRELLNALKGWQPASISQQDDITLIAVDVL